MSNEREGLRDATVERLAKILWAIPVLPDKIERIAKTFGSGTISDPDAMWAQTGNALEISERSKEQCRESARAFLALLPQAQEPVAWRWRACDDSDGYRSDWSLDHADPRGRVLQQEGVRLEVVPLVPVGASPVATQTQPMPYEDREGTTHWEGCWRERGHHNCAVAMVERLTQAQEPVGEVCGFYDDGSPSVEWREGSIAEGDRLYASPVASAPCREDEAHGAGMMAATHDAHSQLADVAGRMKAYGYDARTLEVLTDHIFGGAEIPLPASVPEPKDHAPKHDRDEILRLIAEDSQRIEAGKPSICAGCRREIRSRVHLYRCTECALPFHLPCARRHFAESASAPEEEREAALRAELVTAWNESAEWRDFDKACFEGELAQRIAPIVDRIVKEDAFRLRATPTEEQT